MKVKKRDREKIEKAKRKQEGEKRDGEMTEKRGKGRK